MPMVHYKPKTFRILNTVHYSVLGFRERDFSLDSTAVIIFNNSDHTDIMVSATCVPAAL